MSWTSGDGVSLDVLAPSMPFLADTGDDVNENSIVIMLHAGAFRELFMGDAGEASEARLLASGGDLHAVVVKVGHHGSRYTSTAAFVTAVDPRLAAISVGRHNTFGIQLRRRSKHGVAPPPISFVPIFAVRSR